MAPLTTLKSITSQRVRPPKPPGHSWPKRQQYDKYISRQEAQNAINADVEEWHSYTLAKADELANRHDKNRRYFLNLFFQAGQEMIYQRTKTNAHNAWISLKAAELRSDGDKENAVKIQHDYATEYHALNQEEHDELIAEFESMKDEGLKLHRPTSRACIQDVANVSRNMEILLNGLKDCVGIEGFFCLICNNINFHLKPIWYFTAKEIAEYMPVAVGKKWDTSGVASKLEAFAIAGCDVINLNRTSQQKANQLKREISDMIGQMLVVITGNLKATIKYVNYEEAIVHKYSVELVGWTHEKFGNPSELSNSLEPLRALWSTLKNGSCKFVKLSLAEHAGKRKKANGTGSSGKDDDDDEGSTERPHKRVKSCANVDDSDVEGNNDSPNAPAS